MNKIVFFDLETSGLNKEHHAIVQIGAIAFDVATFKEVERVDIPVAFKFENASPQALVINSVSNGTDFSYTDVGGLPETMAGLNGQEHDAFKRIVQKWNESAMGTRQAERHFSQFLKRHATVSKISKAGNVYQVAQLAGHNVTNFDMPFLKAWYKRLGDGEWGKFLPANWFALDTLNMALANQAIGGIDYADLKLETLLRHHGIAESQTHDALSDVAQTAALCQMMYHNIGFDNDIEAKQNAASEKAQMVMDGIPTATKMEMGMIEYEQEVKI